jgi:hypothetical protein
MKKISKNPLTSSGPIKNIINLKETELKFSFKHLDSNEKFNIRSASEGYIFVFLERLKSLSSMYVHDFKTTKNQSLRAHKHKWKETTEKAGFRCLNEQLRQCEPWQFQISVNEHGRVHGILVNDVFYIIWVDPLHNLYQ